jgi:hypothetical protein
LPNHEIVMLCEDTCVSIRGGVREFNIYWKSILVRDWSKRVG